MSKPGWLYFIQRAHRDGTGPIKIGHASNVDGRLRDLQIGNHRKLDVICSIFITDDILAIEADLHKRFAAQRIRGEWFAWSQALYDAALAIVNLQNRLVWKQLGVA